MWDLGGTVAGLPGELKVTEVKRDIRAGNRSLSVRGFYRGCPQRDKHWNGATADVWFPHTVVNSGKIVWLNQ